MITSHITKEHLGITHSVLTKAWAILNEYGLKINSSKEVAGNVAPVLSVEYIIRLLSGTEETTF